MVFLIIPPIAVLLALLWVSWTARTRRAPEIDDTIAAHRRFTQAMDSAPRGARSGRGPRR